MTPSGAGRHCAACDKVVVDFTTMTEAELLRYFKNRPQNTCGRLRADQLRPYVLPSKAFTLGWKPAWAAASLLLATLLARPATGQVVHQSNLPGIHLPADYEQKPGSGFWVRVRAIEAATRKPLVNISVKHEGNLVGYTDEEGFLEVYLDAPPQVGEVLRLNRTGYVAHEIVFREEDVQRGRLDIQIALHDGIICEAEPGTIAHLVAGGIAVVELPRPWPFRWLDRRKNRR